MNARTALLALAAALASACGPHRLPGTEIPDTNDTRAISDTVERYRQALEKRDVDGILALVAPSYYDTAGTPDPADDLDRARLEAALREQLPKAESLKVDFTLRRIDVSGDEAEAEIFFDSFYRVKTPTTQVPRRDSDVERLKLKRIDGKWLFVSGL
jgi:ketosteroid isomerase-like protein